MSVSVTHKFTSAKGDSSDASLIRPSNWNDEHNITMATARLLGRYTSGVGAVQELTLSNEFDISSGQLKLSDGYNTDLAKKANKATLVSEQPLVDYTKFQGPNQLAIFNSTEGNGKITVSDFITAFSIVTNTRRVIAAGSLFNQGNNSDLDSDITIKMIVPRSLNATTINEAADDLGHTHTINTTNIVSVGSGNLVPDQVGSTGLFKNVTSGNPNMVQNDTCPGNDLRWANVINSTSSGPNAAGTWKLNGYVSGNDQGRISVFKRINPPAVAVELAEYRNAASNGDGTINAEVYYDETDEWIPATLRDDDSEDWYRTLHARVEAEGMVGAYMAPTAQQKRERMPLLTQKQMRRALMDAGFNSSAIITALNGIADPTTQELANIEFQYGDRFNRLDPSVIMVLSILGFTAGSMDSFWGIASTI